MAWTQSHTVLRRHRKLVELAKSLRLKPVYALGHLHLLWHVALEQQEDGDLSSWTDDFLAAAADFDGDAPQFVSLLRLHGWLDGGLIHDWLDYAGRYLESKYRTSNPERLAEIWAKHKKSDSSLSKDGPDKIDKTLSPKPPQAGAPASPARHNGSRANGTNPRSIASKAAASERAARLAEEARRRSANLPGDDEVLGDHEFKKMRKALGMPLPKAVPR